MDIKGFDGVAQGQGKDKWGTQGLKGGKTTPVIWLTRGGVGFWGGRKRGWSF